MVSAAAFVRQLVTAYLHHGYWWYVADTIPAHKRDLHKVDRNIIDRWRIDLPRRQRILRKHQGRANLHYLRHDRFFVILATGGQHEFKQHNAASLRCIKNDRLFYGGYSVRYAQAGYKSRAKWKDPNIAERDPKRRAHVRIERREYEALRAQFLELALHRSVDYLRAVFWNVPFDAYQPVQWQLHVIRREVNALRKTAGIEPLSPDCVRSKLQPMRRYMGDSTEASCQRVFPTTETTSGVFD